jgi:phage gpG-like protein
MIQTTVQVRATRDDIRREIVNLVSTAKAGGHVADAVMSRVGNAVLKHVSRAFSVKARGGTDEAGERWQPLSRYTIARRKAKYNGTPPHGNEILRETGTLGDSLKPGATMMTGPPLQVFSAKNGVAVVGTNRKYAGKHHRGTKYIPQRRLWPAPKKWPPSWWQDLLRVAADGLNNLLIYLIKGTR